MAIGSERQSRRLPGRPLGSRAAFSQGFTRDLAEVWQAKGKQAMNWTADNQPAVFFATCARLLPNDVRVTVEQQNRHHPPGRFITCTALTFTLAAIAQSYGVAISMISRL